MEHSNLSFEDFPTQSHEEWKSKILTDLKGKDYEETLVWIDESAIAHQPFYNKESIANQELVYHIQALQKHEQAWQSIQSFDFDEPKLKEKVDHSLAQGSDLVIINKVYDSQKVKSLLEDTFQDHRVYLLLTHLEDNKTTKRFYIDPIAEMLSNKKVDDAAFKKLESIIQHRLNNFKSDGYLLVDGSIYKNAGATIIQELAYILQHIVEYFDRLTNDGFPAEAISRSLTIKHAVGSSYFSEIAKSRALRYLVHKVFAAYEVSAPVKIWGAASSYYQAHKDAHTNLLRLTSQAMSMIVGNCDLIELPAFDAKEESSALGLRMSKNIPLILKSESHFDKVSDLAAGSYYIEQLSAEMATEAWELFKQLEKEGGLLASLENGKLMAALKKSNEKRVADYKKENKKMVGVNKYENPLGRDLNIKDSVENEFEAALLSKQITR